MAFDWTNIINGESGKSVRTKLNVLGNYIKSIDNLTEALETVDALYTAIGGAVRFDGTQVLDMAQKRKARSNQGMVDYYLSDYTQGAGVTTAAWLQSAIDSVEALGGGILNVGKLALVFGGQSIAMKSGVFLHFNATTISHSSSVWFYATGVQNWGISGKLTVTGPHTTNNYSAVISGCSDFDIDNVTLRTGNSGWQITNCTEFVISRARFFNCYATGIRVDGTSANGIIDRPWGRNMAGFLVYGTGTAKNITVLNGRKTLDTLATPLTTYLTTQLEPAVVAEDEFGSFTTLPFIGEEGVGLTIETRNWTIIGGHFSGVGDNGISCTGDGHTIIGVTVRENKHDGIHCYGKLMTVVGCLALFNGKGAAKADDAGDLDFSPINGYGFAARANAGASPYRCRFIGCYAEGNRKGPFNAGGAALYRPWVSGSYDAKNYCYVTIAGLTHIWAGSATADYFGTTTLASTGWTYNATTGVPSETTWVDGARGYKTVKVATTVGTGTCYGATQSLLVGNQVGTYRIRCTATAANGGTFELRDPANVLLETLVISGGSVTSSVQLAFRIADGTTDFAIGDGWDITVSNVTWTYKSTVPENKGPWAFGTRLIGCQSDKDKVSEMFIIDEDVPDWAENGTDDTLSDVWKLGTPAQELRSHAASIRFRTVHSFQVSDLVFQTARGTPEAPTNISSGTTILKLSPQGYRHGDYRPMGKFQASVSGFDRIDEPRTSWRMTFPTFEHGANILTMSWTGGIVTFTTDVPLDVVSGDTIAIRRTVPDGYNSTAKAILVVDPTTYSYALTTNPGVVTTLGVASADDATDATCVYWSSDGKMVLSPSSIESTSPAARLQVYEDMTADIYAVTNEAMLVDGNFTNVSGVNRLTVPMNGLAQVTSSTVTLTGNKTVDRIECALNTTLRPIIVLRHQNATYTTTLVNSSTYLRLNDAGNFVMTNRDSITLMRVTGTTGEQVWIELGRSRNTDNRNHRSLGTSGARVIPKTISCNASATVPMATTERYFMPIQLNAGDVVNSLSFELTTTAPGSFVRMALYAHSRSTRKSGNLLVDAGEFDTSVSIGTKTLTFGSPYTALEDGWYWIMIQATGSPTLRDANPAEAVLGATASTAQAKSLATTGATYGAPPGTPPSTSRNISGPYVCANLN